MIEISEHKNCHMSFMIDWIKQRKLF